MEARGWCCVFLLALSGTFVSAKSISTQDVSEREAKSIESVSDAFIDERPALLSESAENDVNSKLLSEKDVSGEDEIDTDVSDLPDVLSQEDADEIEKKLEEEGSKYVLEDFDPLPMPTSFSSYDVDGNGGISLAELKQVSGASENLEEAFMACDKDENGEINDEEFESAPWRLQPFRSRN